MDILGIETSCDETAAAVVRDGREIRSNVVASQFDIHHRYGGVVPELACRRHIESIIPVIDEALESAQTPLSEIDLIAVTQGPGLIGALLVGLSTAKAMAYASSKPLLGVNHLAGHIYSIFLEYPDLTFPCLALVVSGGHTELYRVDQHGLFYQLGTTLDDAAGEAFDKVAKMLGLGYPGGPVIDRYAQQGDPQAISFPRPVLNRESLDFSFSGLKTAVSLFIRANQDNMNERLRQDIAASFQQAAVDVLVMKTLQAARQTRVKNVIVVGGVACNSQLRRELSQRAQELGLTIFFPRPSLCTDNAAMIACAAHYLTSSSPPLEPPAYLELDAVADLSLV